MGTNGDDATFKGRQIANEFDNFSARSQRRWNVKRLLQVLAQQDFVDPLTYEIFERNLVTNSEQVENTIKSLNPVGGGIDNISSDILKYTYQGCTYSSITLYLNICLSGGNFPDLLEIASIVPIYKFGERGRLQASVQYPYFLSSIR